MLIERPVIPEAIFTAANASVPGLNGIAGAFVPLHDGTCVVSDRSAAAHFVEAIALLCVLVVPRLNKEAGIVVGAAIACVVDASAIELLGAAEAVQRGNLAEDEQMGDHAHHDVGDWRATGNVDDRLVD